jgi:hypothetical protein
MPGTANPEGSKDSNKTVPETPTNAILVTGATHARELLSSQVPLFLCLKLIHQGII